MVRSSHWVNVEYSRRSTGRSGYGSRTRRGNPLVSAPGRLRPRSPRWRQWAHDGTLTVRAGRRGRGYRHRCHQLVRPVSVGGPRNLATIGGTIGSQAAAYASKSRCAASCTCLSGTGYDISRSTQTGLSDFTPSLSGELALEDRSALRRVAGYRPSADVRVEYRQLRLERVVLVSVDRGQRG